MPTKTGLAYLKESLNSNQDLDKLVQSIEELNLKMISARVTDIVLDETNKEKFEKYGGWNGIGTINWEPINTPASKNQVQPTARPFFPQFKNYPLAEERLMHLISQEPADELKVQALYHLFRMASTQNDPLAAEYKSVLLEEYPQTAFAQLISDPENFDNSELITPEALYKDILDLF